MLLEAFSRCEELCRKLAVLRECGQESLQFYWFEATGQAQGGGRAEGCEEPGHLRETGLGPAPSGHMSKRLCESLRTSLTSSGQQQSASSRT
eukprot:1133691-Pelagomonas_calceolata.AAC.1